MSAGPLVSIGMPLYNEEEYLREALESLRGQEYQNIEILISNNASTDATAAICEEIARQDSRVTVEQHELNIGAQTNFSHLVPLAKGKYFFWAAGHDLWASTFIGKCVEILEDDPSVVLAYPQTRRMHADGSPMDIYPSNIDTRNLAPAKRYSKFLWHTDCNLIYGVWRREALLKSGLFRDVYGPDQLLLSEMTFLGTFAKVQEPLWFRRYQRAPETSDEKKNRILHDLQPSKAEQRRKESLTDHYRALRGHHIRLLKEADLSLLSHLNLSLQTRLAYAVRCNVFPGAVLLKRIANCILPASFRRKIVSWLRSG